MPRSERLVKETEKKGKNQQKNAKRSSLSYSDSVQ